MVTSISVESTDEHTFATIRDHHAALRADLDERVDALRAAVSTSAPYEEPLAALTAFVTDSVLPHAVVEEEVLYAAARPTAEPFIDAMRLEHRALAERTLTLTKGGEPFGVLAAADGLAALFAVHVTKENDLLLPLLERIPEVEPARLLDAMHRRLADSDDVRERVRELLADAEPDLDVRTLPHGRGRHEAIFARLAELPTGGRLVIVNDHDPKPLHRQIDAAWPDTYGWEYLGSGPRLWRVAITRLG